MIAFAHLFDPATGKRAVIRDEYDSGTALGMDYMWTEGNYACDCNRRLFMARALKEPELEDPNNPCGNTIKLEKLTFSPETKAG